MGNTLVGPGVLRETLEYPPTTEGSIMVGRNNNPSSSHSHRHHPSTSNNSAPSGPLGGLGGLLATPPSTVGGRFRRSYFGQFVFLIGFLSLIIFLQDSLLSPSRFGKSPVVVVGGERDVDRVRLEDSTEFNPVDTAVPIPQPLLLQQQEEKQRQHKEVNEVEQLVQDLKEDEMAEETEAATMSAPLTRDGANTAANTKITPNNNDRKGMRAKTKQWIKSFANIIIGHDPQLGMLDDEGLAVFIPEIKQVGQEAEMVSLPLVLDVPGKAAIPNYESLPDPTIDPLLSQPATGVQQPPLHANQHWTGNSIQMALDPNFQDPADAPPRPRPQDKGDKVSRLEIVQWQQEQDLSECRGRNDGYEHEIDGLRHLVEEQDSDLKELRRLVDELKAQAAAFEAELE
ncbi:hypothetical protein EC991_011282 [Linnemannia zychae]|nr:hypothetical protein EC991_011282 [Linnemannia zychae]